MVSLEGAEDFDRFAKAVKELADKDLNKSVRGAMRKVAKPVGEEVMREAAGEMPHKGGISALIAASRVGVSFRLSSTPSVALLLRDKSGHDLKSLEKGILRHPVFLRKRSGLLRRKTGRGKTGHVLGGEDRKGWTWVAQKVPEGAFSRAFEKQKGRVTTEVVTAVQDALRDAAKKV
jgi:hypothetical protein